MSCNHSLIYARVSDEGGEDEDDRLESGLDLSWSDLQYRPIFKGKEQEPLGFEMTKLGNSPNYVSRVEPASAAALSGLCVDDYLIELNDRNIEDLDNDLLKQAIYHHLEPKNGGEIAFTTLNKDGYDYCVQNGIKPGNFVQINRAAIKTYQTPNELSAAPQHQTPPPSLPPQPQPQPPQPPQQPPPPVIVTAPSTSRDNKSTSTQELPRVCILRKTSESDELGFSIARIKDLKEHVINDVVPGSLADRAGLRPNDCLLEVNGENVENKSHIETVKKISELKQLRNVDINLLVVQKEYLNIQNTLSNSKLTKTSSISTPDLFMSTNVGEAGAPSSAGVVTVVNKNLAQSSSRSQSSKRIDLAGLGDGTGSGSLATAVTSLSGGPRSINHYPDVKVCEFIGYPRGTQLGLVVTSDDYSHDVVKVADGSPADQCGIVKGDVIIAVNDINVEGQPTAIELLNDFDEQRSLKILAASRYAYEWSKLLKIRIAERDWPNIKKTSTRHVMSSTMTTTTTTRQQAVTNNYYEPAGTNTLTTTKQQQQPILYGQSQFNGQQFNRASSANASYNQLPIQSQVTSAAATSTTPRKTGSSSYYVNNRPATAGYLDNWRTSRRATENLSTLGRSAVDITADGRVLRLCTLILNPNSPNITDSEFGFDLVTKIGGGPTSTNRISDYYIDTIDENSPASRSGLRPGDRLVEVDGLDVTVRTFEQVVQLINEAKQRCKLKLLVYPSAILNYGNPDITRQVNYAPAPQSSFSSIPVHTSSTIQAVDSRSMPDLSIQQQPQYQYQPSYYTNGNIANYQQQPPASYNGASKTLYKQQKRQVVTATKYPNQVANDYDSIYLKRQNQANGGNLNSQMSKSSSNLYNGAAPPLTVANSSYSLESSLRPVPRLCTIYKSDHSTNIGFGITTKPHVVNYSTVIPPQYMRVTIVNYKSPAYKSGLEAGDIIIEVNGRSTLQMTPDETLHFIKSSYEVNSFVKLLVVSEFCYQWLYENDLLPTLHSDHRSVFSYADYLKHNHRFVPRQCKIKLFPFSKSFGFSVDSILVSQAAVTNGGRSSNGAPSYAHIVMRVDRDSPAFTSSLLKGDRIIECDGINVEHENEQQITERIYQAFVGQKQITLFVVDPDTDNFFKAKCIKLHSFLPIVQSITNSTDI